MGTTKAMRMPTSAAARWTASASVIITSGGRDKWQWTADAKPPSAIREKATPATR
ncbi:MAG: hypothetical protein VB959_15075 [Rhodospirillales bacterium]